MKQQTTSCVIITTCCICLCAVLLITIIFTDQVDEAALKSRYTSVDGILTQSRDTSNIRGNPIININITNINQTILKFLMKQDFYTKYPLIPLNITNITLIDITYPYSNTNNMHSVSKTSDCLCYTQTPGRKLFLLGFPKTGTESFHAMLSSIGCKSMHQFVKYNGTKYSDIGRLIYKAYDEDKELLYYVPDAYIAFTQLDSEYGINRNYWPQIDFFKLLYEQYPESLFILNYRDISNLIKSISNWFTLRKRLTKLNITGLPSGMGGKDDEMKLWILQHYFNVISFFNQHKNANFIVYDIEKQNITKLRTFLQCHNITMPHHHKSKKKK